MVIVSHLTSKNHSGVNIHDLASRLVVGRDTYLKTLEAITQRVERQSNFSLVGKCLVYLYDRLHYKRLHDWFYSDTT